MHMGEISPERLAPIQDFNVTQSPFDLSLRSPLEVTSARKSAKKGFLRIGDVISLVSKYDMTEGQPFVGVVSGDGIALN